MLSLRLARRSDGGTNKPRFLDTVGSVCAGTMLALLLLGGRGTRSLFAQGVDTRRLQEATYRTRRDRCARYFHSPGRGSAQTHRQYLEGQRHLPIVELKRAA